MSVTIVADAATGQNYDLGVITMRLLVGAVSTGGAFSVSEFGGVEGPWTIPHLHRHGEESFYVLEGDFIFTIGHEDVSVETGGFVLVPRGTRHMMRAGSGGGRLLALWTPGGPEALFVELSRLPADSLRDPDARRRLSARFDSIPA